MRKLGAAAGALALCLSAETAAAFEWNGFQSGMTPEEVRNAAHRQGLGLDRDPGSAANVTVPLYAREGGETRGFVTLCQGRLARVGGALKELDVARAAHLADEYAQHGNAQLRTMTTQTGGRGLEFFWTARSDQMGFVMLRLGKRQYLQETRTNVGLWNLCAGKGAAPHVETVDPAASAGDKKPPTAEELFQDSLAHTAASAGGDR